MFSTVPKSNPRMYNILGSCVFPIKPMPNSVPVQPYLQIQNWQYTLSIKAWYIIFQLYMTIYSVPYLSEDKKGTLVIRQITCPIVVIYHFILCPIISPTYINDLKKGQNIILIPFILLFCYPKFFQLLKKLTFTN